MGRRAPDRSAAEFLPAVITVPALRAAAETCTGCDLYQRATQTVFGEGAPHANVLFVGEQPGDQEDRAGHPFVGPAGRILDKALAEAGILRDDVYITNAVKHFKWEPQGKRRKHKKPSAAEIAACRPWLETEIKAVQPRIVVCLGATAAQSMFGKVVRLNEVRGKFLETSWAPVVMVTVHPSSILRYPDRTQQEAAYRQFVDELTLVRRKLLERSS
jgi:uracil-DNA glycosylase